LRRLPRRIYPFRILGMALGGVPMAAVLVELRAPLAAWVFLVFTALVWPHLAYRIAVRSRDPYRAETRNLLFDSALAAAWVPLMHFNLLPSALIVTLTMVDKISTGIRGLWLRSLPGMLLAGLAAALLTGFAFAPATSMPVLLACLPVLLIHTVSVSLGSYRLIRKVREQNLQLDQLRRIDTLTGLSGRGDWEEQAEQVLRERTSDGDHASLLLIDIDRFKRVNDDHGHGAGDEVLRAIASQLRLALRPQDCAGRMGGDEFAVLLPGTPAAEAAQVAERIRHAVERVRLQGFTDVRPTVSIGIAAAEPAHDLRAWLDSADSALYRAKDKGRNQIMHNASQATG
jgi:diguanylate cyclase